MDVDCNWSSLVESVDASDWPLVESAVIGTSSDWPLVESSVDASFDWPLVESALASDWSPVDALSVDCNDASVIGGCCGCGRGCKG